MSQGKTDDKLMVLSPSQKRAVQDTWALVYADAETNGIEMMIRLFQQMPHAQSYFDKFRDATNDELRGNEALRYHASKMMDGLNSLVINLHDASSLRDNIRLLSSDHAEKGVRSSDFQIAFGILQTLLRDRLGDKYDDSTAASWKQFCNIIWKIMDTEMESSSSV